LFPLIGVALLIWAVRATIRWKRFGTSVVQMPSVPGIVGGPVAGTIQTALRELPERGFELKLRSIHRTVSGSGKNRSTKERILWQEEQRVKKEELFPGYLGTSARFSFQIPGDCRPTDQEDSRSSVIWTLQVTANVPGVDYNATFDIPVFRTEDSSAASTAVNEEVRRVSGEELHHLRQDSKIRVRIRPDSGKEIFFPAARNPGMAAGLTLFFLIWSGFIWLLLHLGAPKIFPVVFGLFWMLIFFGVLDMWFGTSRLIVNAGDVVVKSGFLGIGRPRTFSPSEIEDIKTKIGTQSGGRSGTPFYDLVLVRRTGRDILIGRYIKNKREAEWLIGEVKDSLAAAKV
jgi:hypothetical protein